MMIKNFKLNNKALATLLLSSALTLSGCKANCDVEGQHAHLYTYKYENEYLISQYIVSEEKYINGLTRQDYYKFVDDEEAKKLNFISDNSNCLLKIDKNKGYVKYITKNCTNYYDYECSFTTYRVYNSNSPAIPVENTYYSKDPYNEDCTGRKRLHYYTFYGYNLQLNSNGEYELIRSKEYYTMDEVVKNCEYIPKGCYIKYKTQNENRIEDIENAINLEIEENDTKTR